MYAYLKIVTVILNSFSPVKDQLAPLCLNNILPVLFSYYLLPNFLIFEKCAFLGNYPARSVTHFTKFRNIPEGPNFKCQTQGYSPTLKGLV